MFDSRRSVADLHLHIESDSHANSDADIDRFCDSNLDVHSEPDRDAHADEDCNGVTDAHADGDRHVDSHRDADGEPDTDGHGHAGPRCADSHSDLHGDANAAAAHGYTDTYEHAELRRIHPPRPRRRHRPPEAPAGRHRSRGSSVSSGQRKLRRRPGYFAPDRDDSRYQVGIDFFPAIRSFSLPSLGHAVFQSTILDPSAQS